MMRGGAPGARQEKARRILLHLLGGGDMRAVLWVLALLVGLGWFTDSLFEWLVDIGDAAGGGKVEDWFPLHRVIAVAAFVAVLARLSWLARGARKRYRPRVGREDRPAQTKGLILFLSNLWTVDQARLANKLHALDGIGAFRELEGKLNWRMPLEAIAYHLPRLSHVVVICSRGEGEGEQRTPGSAEQLQLFREVCNQVFPGAELVLHDAAALDSRFGGGLSFEDVDAVSHATDEAFQWLLDRGLALADILIDVTGGQKPNAVAATAVALAEGRRIQYVACPRSGGDCRVTVYDVTYDQ